MMRKWMPLLVIAITGGLTAVAIEFLPHTVFFPVLELAAPGGLRITFLQPGRTERSECEKIVADMAAANGANCPDCKLDYRCTRDLSAEQRRVLSREPISLPSARVDSGALTITFASVDPNLALAACQQSAQQSLTQIANARMRCSAAGVPR